MGKCKSNYLTNGEGQSKVAGNMEKKAQALKEKCNTIPPNYRKQSVIC